MRGQQVYCLRSVTSNNQFDIRSLFLVMFDDAAASPAFFVEGKQLHIGAMLTNTTLYLQQQFTLVDVTEISKEGAVLNTLQAIIETGIGDFCPRTIMRDVVDQQAAHVFTTPLQMARTVPARHVRRGQGDGPGFAG